MVDIFLIFRGERERIKINENRGGESSSSPASHIQGKNKNHGAIQNDIVWVSFFFHWTMFFEWARPDPYQWAGPDPTQNQMGRLLCLSTVTSPPFAAERELNHVLHENADSGGRLPTVAWRRCCWWWRHGGRRFSSPSFSVFLFLFLLLASLLSLLFSSLFILPFVVFSLSLSHFVSLFFFFCPFVPLLCFCIYR